MTTAPSRLVSTLLEILDRREVEAVVSHFLYVSTLLEILDGEERGGGGERDSGRFQPFLRFWGLCIRFLWVFKFFFGFL